MCASWNRCLRPARVAKRLSRQGASSAGRPSGARTMREEDAWRTMRRHSTLSPLPRGASRGGIPLLGWAPSSSQRLPAFHLHLHRHLHFSFQPSVASGPPALPPLPPSGACARRPARKRCSHRQIGRSLVIFSTISVYNLPGTKRAWHTLVVQPKELRMHQPPPVCSCRPVSLLLFPFTCAHPGRGNPGNGA